MATLKIENNKRLINCIQIYAPTSTAEDKEIENFYNDLNNTIRKFNKGREDLIIMGDWNSQIGQRERGEKQILGKYNYGK